MISYISNFLKFNSGALKDATGGQVPAPSMALVEDTKLLGADGALQISAVWACVDRRATTVASLPIMVYDQVNGEKVLARTSRLYNLLHESPNSRMTPFEFWRAMILNYDLRGNAYARLERDKNGEVVAMWVMSADQVKVQVLDDGSIAYYYTIDNNVAVFDETNVLHLKNLGNGTTGLAKLEFMRATTDEVSKSQAQASRLFANGGKPSGILMVDAVLKPEQREAIRRNFSDMAMSSVSTLKVLEANMKYQQLGLSPEDLQLLETRQYGVEEIARWFDVPPVMIHHSNVTTWGSGVEQIMDAFYKLTLRPLLVSIEQSIKKRVMTAKQRANQTIEFSFDALLRGNSTQRAEFYSKGLQNGWTTRAEVRQLENLPPLPDTDFLTAQSNLVPLDKLGFNVDNTQQAVDFTKSDKLEQKFNDLMANISNKESTQSKIQVQMMNGLTQQDVIDAMTSIPINVTVHNEVNPTPFNLSPNVNVDVSAPNVNLEAIVEMSKVELTMPNRRTETIVSRDDEGNITRAVQYEKDV